MSVHRQSCGEAGVALVSELISKRKRSGNALPERAAAYVRMSTDHQKYSIPYQLVAIKNYADRHGLDVQRIYEDAGRSGLNLQGRDGLKQLLADVLTGQPEYSTIIVYDVSRWGRFQDVDEAGYYEHLCRRLGVRVVYCAEPFADITGPLTSIVKSVKRVMASEYSRELSERVSASLCYAASIGRNQGGGVIFGLQRVLYRKDGKRLKVLGRGERKLTSDFYIQLEPGDPSEVRTVRRVFRMYVRDQMTIAEITRWLNNHRVKSHYSDRWYHGSVKYLLTNEKYIGTQIYNRTSGKLRTKRRFNDRALWIRVPGAFKAIVDPKVFWAAQDIWKRRAEGHSDEDLLADLRACVEKNGIVAGQRFMEYGLLCAKSYSNRFGSVQRAYERLGITDLPPLMRSDERHAIRRHRLALLAQINVALETMGGSCGESVEGKCFLVNGWLRGRLIVLRPTLTPSGALCWPLKFFGRKEAEFFLIERLDRFGWKAIDYYLVPVAALKVGHLTLYSVNGIEFDQYRRLDFQALIADLVRISSATNLATQTDRAVIFSTH